MITFKIIKTGKESDKRLKKGKVLGAITEFKEVARSNIKIIK